MRKNLLLVIAILIAGSLSAQVYTGLGFGYSMGANKTVKGTELSGTTYTNNYGSYGQGFNLHLKGGYMINEFIGIELGVNYLFGSTIAIESSEFYIEEGKNSSLRIAPQIVIKPASSFYGRFGAFIPISGKTVITSTDDKYKPILASPAMKLETTIETKGSFSLGFIGAVGYEFELSDDLFLYGELEYIGLAIKSGTAELTQYDLNGEDMLPALNTSDKKFESVDEINILDPRPANEPTKVFREVAPFSSFGINFGIKKTF